jgi:hypothetical protein
MRQQFLDATVRLRGQPFEHVAQVGIGVIPVELRQLHQAHHCRCALPGAQRTREQPARTSDSDRPIAILDPVVIDGQRPVIEKARECYPASKAVVDRFWDSRAVGRSPSALRQSLIHRVGDWLRASLPQLVALVGVEFARVSLSFAQRAEKIERLLCERAGVIRPQIVELAVKDLRSCEQSQRS